MLHDASVLQPIPDASRPGHSLATLTLTTCNPKYSATQRIVVHAVLTDQRPKTAGLPTALVR